MSLRQTNNNRTHTYLPSRYSVHQVIRHLSKENFFNFQGLGAKDKGTSPPKMCYVLIAKLCLCVKYANELIDFHMKPRENQALLLVRLTKNISDYFAYDYKTTEYSMSNA